MTSNRRPANAQERIWVVLRADGERYTIDRELLGGIREWAAGQKGITILEYRFNAVVYDAPLDAPPEPGKK
jgi:hypothetical protein